MKQRRPSNQLRIAVELADKVGCACGYDTWSCSLHNWVQGGEVTYLLKESESDFKWNSGETRSRSTSVKW